MRIYLIAAFNLLSIGLAAQSPRSEKIDTERIERLQTQVERLRKKYHIPSLSLGIVHNHELEYYHGFGYADVENKLHQISTPSIIWHR